MSKLFFKLLSLNNFFKHKPCVTKGFIYCFVGFLLFQILTALHKPIKQVLYIKPFYFVRSKPNSLIQTFYSYRRLSGYVLLQLSVPEAIGDPMEYLPSGNARSINSLLHENEATILSAKCTNKTELLPKALQSE